MFIACWLLNFLQQKYCENRLVNKNVMVCCMTCPWAPTAGGTTAQSAQRNDGVTAPNTQQLHQRLGHINRTLHADIQKPTTLEKTFNNLHKEIFVFITNKYMLLKKFAFDCWHNTVLWYTTHKTQYKIHSWFIISFETFFLPFLGRWFVWVGLV